MPCGEIINYGHGTNCIFSVRILITTDPKACTQNTILFIVEMLLHFVLVRKVDLPLPTKIYSAKPFLAHGYTPLSGLRPTGAILLLSATVEILIVLWYTC